VRVGCRLISKRSTTREKYPSGAGIFKREGLPERRDVSGLFGALARVKSLGMTPDTELAGTAINRIRPKRHVSKGVIIGSNSR
jgi:hypothetical protein